jgi:hypothetical protein
MTTPFLHHELFEINDNLEPEVKKVGEYQYLCIDNFYKNPYQINQMFKESWIQNFKIHPNGSNFKDYYDCRSHIPMDYYGFDNENKTENYLKNLLNLKDHYCHRINTNVFSWINPPQSSFQFTPHTDPSYNILVYLDDISSGGTALYEKLPISDKSETMDIRNDITKEGINFDVIPSAMNRCVIFDGNIPHGGYIEDHSKYSNGNWRYNTVYFFKKWQN